jgi:hypothetical protein
MQNRQFRLTSTFLFFLFSLSVSGCFFAQSSLKQTSVVATDYQKLEQLLDQDNWREADLETFNKLLIIANRQEEGWLRNED